MAEQGVAAVDRALALLAVFEEDDEALPLAELARRSGLYKSTILRLCASLERAGYLRRLSDGKYRLGPALLKLGQFYQKSFKLEGYVLPTLRQLAKSTGESASFYIREGDKRICLFRVNSPLHRVLHYVTAGTQLPLETGAAGKVLLAFTEDDEACAAVRRELLVVSASRRKSDTAALACPIFSAQRGFVGAMSLAGPRTRFTETELVVMSRQLLEAAADLTDALGGASLALRERAGGKL